MKEARPHYIWRSMKARCHNPNSKDWPRYGGRGIFVCQRWLESFANFWADMCDSYNDALQIERIDNENGYFKENCRWATQKEQGRNKRNNLRIRSPWGYITISEAAEKIGISPATILSRINDCWVESDLLLPPGKFRRAINMRTRIVSSPWGEMPLHEAAAKSGISESLLRYRLNNPDWPAECIFMRPQRRG